MLVLLLAAIIDFSKHFFITLRWATNNVMCDCFSVLNKQLFGGKSRKHICVLFDCRRIAFANCRRHVGINAPSLLCNEPRVIQTGFIAARILFFKTRFDKVFRITEYSRRLNFFAKPTYKLNFRNIIFKNLEKTLNMFSHFWVSFMHFRWNDW